MVIKYLSYGPEVNVIQTLNDGKVLVEPIFENPNDGEPYEGNPFIVNANQIFDKPPIQKKAEEVIKLNEQISELNMKLRDLRQEVSGFEKTHEDRMSEIKRHKGLELLENFIAGKITHYVEINSYGTPKIIPFNESESDYGVKPKGRATNGKGVRRLRLLSLFGKATGDLEWGLSRYSDGSGCYSTVIPCASLETACQVVINWIKETVEKDLDPENKDNRPGRSIIDFAKEYGYVLPKEYIEAVVRKEEEARQKKIEKLEKQLADAKANKPEIDLFEDDDF